MLQQQLQTCNDCFKIICKNCNWEASFLETQSIQKGEMDCCPECGWKPGN